MINKETIDLFHGIDPPSTPLERNTINVKGREEHESWLRDPDRCKDHGIDIVYETMIYLKRWGGWLDGVD